MPPTLRMLGSNVWRLKSAAAQASFRVVRLLVRPNFPGKRGKTYGDRKTVGDSWDEYICEIGVGQRNDERKAMMTAAWCALQSSSSPSRLACLGQFT